MDTPTVEDAKLDLDYVVNQIVKKSHAITVYGDQCWLHGFATGGTMAICIALVAAALSHCVGKGRTAHF